MPMLMGPMIAWVSMLMVAGLCMGMAMRMLVRMSVGMAFRPMLVCMTMFMLVLMRTFHNSSLFHISMLD
jgi:hypothetical protein